MTHRDLFRLLAAMVALPALGACEDVPPCTTQVTGTDTYVPLDQATACELARQVGNEIAYLTTELCTPYCTGVDQLTTCFYDHEYQVAFAAANDGTGAGGGGGGAGGGGTGAGGAGGGSSNFVCPLATATLTCRAIGPAENACVASGRRPAGLSDPVVDGAAIGAYLATSAHLEAASILAFQILHAELRALGAPLSLLDHALSAVADEVRHTAVMTRLASKYGALVPALEVVSAGARTATEIAVENMMEGVVRETFGAAMALFQADHAADPEVRAAMRAIAVDECAHAALSFSVARFLDGLLDTSTRARVEAAKHQAMNGLLAELVEPDSTLRRVVGLPRVAESRQILRAMKAALWTAPLAA